MVEGTLDTEFVVRRWHIFRTALWLGTLTVLTLGIYRFWMKTRLRRLYWSGVRPGGHPIEYVGQPVEKLLGFLIAVVILAFYIGIVNLVLMYLSFSLFEANTVAYVASLAGVVPLWFYARYRARRYVLARTRWRGIRFGVDAGAWGYAMRAMLYWMLTILSLGLLWPVMTYRLEKFRADRTWFGSVQVHQGGSPRTLIAPFLPVWILTVVGIGGLIAGILIAENMTQLEIFESGGVADLVIIAGPIALLLWPLSAILYSVVSWRRLTNAKTAGGLGLQAAPKVWRVAIIYLLGYGLTLFVIVVAGGAWLLGLAAVAMGGMSIDFDPEDLFSAASSMPAATILWVLGYFFLFILWGALRHALVTVPLWRHYARTLTITGAESLRAVRQRDRDDHTEAEGFAEALDLGAAI